MYKVSDEVIKFMQNWKVELTAEGENLADVKILRCIFKDMLSPLLFVIAMMLVSYMQRKCTGDYKCSKSQKNTNRLMYMDNKKM